MCFIDTPSTFESTHMQWSIHINGISSIFSYHPTKLLPFLCVQQRTHTCHAWEHIHACTNIKSTLNNRDKTAASLFSFCPLHSHTCWQWKQQMAVKAEECPLLLTHTPRMVYLFRVNPQHRCSISSPTGR